MSAKTYEGVSDNEDFSEALANAIKAAAANSQLVLWTLDAVKGERGGITGATKVTVTISVEE